MHCVVLLIGAVQSVAGLHHASAQSRIITRRLSIERAFLAGTSVLSAQLLRVEEARASASKDYVDKEFGVSFQIPDDWVVTESDVQGRKVPIA